MALRASIVAIASCVTSLVLVAGTAQAISLPDSGSCSNSSTCLAITNNSSGGAIYGWGSIYGVIGLAPYGHGVEGVATSGIGVYGRATITGGNGVVAQNTDTNHTAAAVSALSGDAQNGLAYWGTGGIQLTSSVAEKAGGGSWQVFSDARIKKDVTPLRLSLEQLRQIRPVTFKYNGLGGTTDDGREYVGVIAQELEKIFPSMVTSRQGKLHPTDATATDIKIVDPSALTYVLINSVKEQQAIIERQDRRIAALERSRGLSASMLGNGAELVLAFGLLPLGFIALRRRQAPKQAS